MSFPRATDADVALLLEGTFPFVSGGVSSWVNQIIRAFPTLRFAIVFIGSRKEDYGEQKYALPDNVVHLETHYLYDFSKVSGPTLPGQIDDKVHGDMLAIHNMFKRGHGDEAGNAAFRSLCEEMMPGGKLTDEQFLHGEQSWTLTCERYRQYCTDPSFVDYFWTVRIMHAPLWQLARIAQELIPARAYHSVSTGYAGFLGALLHHTRHRPLILFEHGIYTKERKIDLFKSE
ncbi:MAG: GT4 family glycosyltransferase PelF, partial [Candidatus Accumulibacter sp.]|nr:GT4 family glycosyltransferase PelF [Accumulibacter sp.]